MSAFQWEDTNNALRHRGLHPIVVTASEMMNFHDAVSTSAVESEEEGESKDVVVLERKSLAAIQDTLHKLMDDCDRRQGLITDLIKTNNSLRDELKSAKEKRRPSSLTPLASLAESNDDNSKRSSTPMTPSLSLVENKVGDEPRKDKTNNRDTLNNNNNNINNNNSNNNKNNENRSATTEFMSSSRKNENIPEGTHFEEQPKTMMPDTKKSSEGRSEWKEKELLEIKTRLDEIEKEESRRRIRRDAVFKRMRKRSVRINNPADDQVSDIIDMYEMEIERITNRRTDNFSPDASVSEMAAPAISHPAATAATTAVSSVTDNLVRSYDRQLREAEAAMRKWKSEMKRMKEEIDARPSQKDLSQAQKRISELEQLLSESQRMKRNSRDENSLAHHNQPGTDEAVLCLDQLKARLGVSGSLDVVSKVDALCRAQGEVRKADKLLRKINDIVENGEEGHKSWCYSSGHKLVETLKRWKAELNHIPQIHRNVEQLRRQLLGGEDSTKDGEKERKNRAKDVLTLSESLLKDNSLPCFNSVNKIDDANQRTMILIISHFQNLFDVDEVPNVITRMNDVYNKMKEIQNILKTLREMLGLDEKSPGSWAIVDAVAQLTNALNASSTRRLQEVLGVGDLESVVNAVGEHRDFCPVFTRVLQKVMEVLVVDSLDKVLPAIHSLKLLATPAPLHEDDGNDAVDGNRAS